MLTYEDCLALSGLTAAEIEAIAEHEHLPPIVAAELGNYLEHCADGSLRIRAMIRDDIAHAVARGDHAHAKTLRAVLRHYVITHRRGTTGSSV